MPVRIVEPRDEALRHQRADLLLREVDHAHDEPPDELLGPIVLRDLRARLLQPDLRTEVDAQHVRRLARFGEHLGADDAPDAQLDLGEIVPGDRDHHSLPAGCSSFVIGTKWIAVSADNGCRTSGPGRYPRTSYSRTPGSVAISSARRNPRF